MANLLQIIIEAKDQASKELEGVTKTIDKLSGQLKVVGAAMTAVGVAGLKMVADAKELNAALAQTGITVGMTTNEMRAIAMGLTDVSSPLKEVTATLEVLARAGIRGEEQLKATAKAFDALGDATGAAANEVAATLIPAFKTFGMEIPSSAGDLDKFTWLVKNTSVDLSDFASAMNYVAREGGDLGVTLNDMIAIMAVLESRGITGTAATMTFRQAVTEAANTGKSLNDVLGITSEQLAEYNQKIGEDAVGATKKYADAANTQYSLMDKLKQKFEELGLAAGSLLEPLEPILGVMTALGPAMIFFSTASGKAVITTTALIAKLVAQAAVLVATKVATVAATVAQWALNVAMSANPIGLIILAVAGLVAGIIALVKHWDDVKAALSKVWDWMKTAFQTVVDFFKKAWDAIVKAFEFVGDKIKAAFQAVGDFFQTIWDGIVNIFKTAANFIAGIINAVIGGFEGFLNFFVEGINFFVQGLNSIVGLVNKALPGGIEIPLVPVLGEIKLGRIPLLDAGGLIQGPGVFAVGEGVKEIVREPSTGDIHNHYHIGYLLGDEHSLRRFVRMVTQMQGEDTRRNAFGQVNSGYYFGRSSI
jgi:hypothetical protein